MASAVTSPLRRHDDNPILTCADIDDPGILVFNPGVARFGDRLLMAYRCDHGTWGDPDIVATDIRFAWSDDGVSWQDDPALCIDRARAVELLQPLEPHRDMERELWRIYDPRLVVLDDAHQGGQRLALTFAADTTHGLRAGSAESADGRSWTAVGLGPPDNRNQVLFPRPIAGRWSRLERPMQSYGGEAMGAERHGIWISHSPDRRHWGDTRFVCDRSLFGFANDKIGPGPPPIATDAGWLCIIHTASNDPEAGRRGWEPVWQRTYHAAALLLDLDDPSRVVAAAPAPLLSPDKAYRYETDGYRNDVIFPSGALVVDGSGQDPELWIYYGAADTSIALATAPLKDVIDFVLSGT
jgi:beta-1,4-mannooligosaccharide/beta-1,4-mannosyl-N-acetylglucosamine phosphorylase